MPYVMCIFYLHMRILFAPRYTPPSHNSLYERVSDVQKFIHYQASKHSIYIFQTFRAKCVCLTNFAVAKSKLFKTKLKKSEKWSKVVGIY